MNIQITDQEKYNSVIKVKNFGAVMVHDDRVDGHLAIIYKENGKQWISSLFGMTTNNTLEEDYGFRFVQGEENIDNSKYYY